MQTTSPPAAMTTPRADTASPPTSCTTRSPPPRPASRTVLRLRRCAAATLAALRSHPCAAAERARCATHPGPTRPVAWRPRSKSATPAASPAPTPPTARRSPRTRRPCTSAAAGAPPVHDRGAQRRRVPLRRLRLRRVARVDGLRLQLPTAAAAHAAAAATALAALAATRAALAAAAVAAGLAPSPPPYSPQDTGIGDDLLPHGGFEIWYSDTSAFFGTKARPCSLASASATSVYAIDRTSRGDYARGRYVSLRIYHPHKRLRFETMQVYGDTGDPLPSPPPPPSPTPPPPCRNIGDACDSLLDPFSRTTAPVAASSSASCWTLRRARWGANWCKRPGAGCLRRRTASRRPNRRRPTPTPKPEEDAPGGTGSRLRGARASCTRGASCPARTGAARPRRRGGHHACASQPERAGGADRDARRHVRRPGRMQPGRPLDLDPQSRRRRRGRAQRRSDALAD